MRIKSLSGKLMLVSSVVVIFTSAYIVSEFLFTQHIKNDSTKINLAGNLRFRSYEMGWMLHMLKKSREAGEKSYWISELNLKISEFEKRAWILRDGDPPRGLRPAMDEDEKKVITEIISRWEAVYKPIVLRAIDLPTAEAEVVTDRYDLTIQEYVKSIDDYVNLLEEKNHEDVHSFGRFRLYVVVVFIICIVLTGSYLRKSIINPIYNLMESTTKVKNGDYNIRVPIETRDEIGTLSDSFNQMSLSLQTAFSAIERQLNDLFSLTRASNTLNTLHLEKNIYDIICNTVTTVFGLKMAWIGFYEDKSYDIKPVGCAYKNEECAWPPARVSLRADSSIPAADRWKPALINRGDPRFESLINEADSLGYNSLLAIPLTLEGEMLTGMLFLYGGSPDDFTQQRIEVLQIFGNLASTAIENYRLMTTLDEKIRDRTTEINEFNQKLRKLYEVSLSKVADSREYATTMLKELADMLDVDGASICRIENNEAISFASVDRKGVGLGAKRLSRINSGCCRHVGPVGETVVIHDSATLEDNSVHQDFVISGFRSYLGVPIVVEDKLWGTLCTFSMKPHFYSDADMMLNQLLKRRLEFELVRDKYENEMKIALLNAEAANKTKSEFLANMTHEMKTPLNIIIGSSEMLRDGLLGPLNDHQFEYMNNVIECGWQQLELINAILDYTRIETGAMTIKPERFMVAETLANYVTIFQERARAHEVALELLIEPEAEMEIEADKVKFRQIMYNLIINALKFSHVGGTVRVIARKKTSDDESGSDLKREEIEITVEDEGIGIKEEDLPRLFKPFTQLESPYVKRYQGSGLGLALSKKLVELHSGKMTVVSEYGKGSRFIFAIPVNQPFVSASM